MTALEELGVGGSRLVALSRMAAENGELIVADDPQLPFTPHRFFVLQHVPAGEARGIHAHRQCEQFLVCLRGAVTALIDDGHTTREVRLDDPSVGLYMPRLIWGTQSDYTEDALLLVLASDAYDRGDYIEDYAEFLSMVGA